MRSPSSSWWVAAALTLIITAFGLVGRSAPLAPLVLPPAPAIAAGADSISPDQLKAYLSFVAHDDREGRGTPSRGLDATAQFIAALLARWGLEPAGDAGQFFQSFSLTRRVVVPTQTHLTLGERTFHYGDDFIAEPTPGHASGALVFVGHGIQVANKTLDPYKNLDVKDRVIIAQAGLPDGLKAADLRGRAGTNWESAQSYGQKHGARAVVLIPDFERLSGWNRTRQALSDGGRLSFPLDPPPATIPTLTASAGLVQALFAGERISGAELLRLTLDRKSADGFVLTPQKSISLEVGVTQTEALTQNVAAVLEGRDPTLRQEVVALGAHYDHMGMRSTGSDRVFNGADDDGSGTSALLAIAEGFVTQQQRPKRSLLFVWHAGEESGLLGSRWLTEHPPMPIERIVTQLNIDMVGRSRLPQDTNPRNSELTGPDELYVIGSKMMSRELGEISERVNKSYLKLKFNYKYDDPDDPQRFFYRSDHFNYARRGVPVIFYFSGVHEDYHQPSDTIDKIDFEKLTKIARTVYVTAAALADAAERPRVDKPLPASVTDR